MALSWPALRHLLPAVQEMQKLSGCTFQLRMAWIGTYHTIFVVYHIWGYEHPAIYIYTSYFGMNSSGFSLDNISEPQEVLASFVCRCLQVFGRVATSLQRCLLAAEVWQDGAVCLDLSQSSQSLASQKSRFFLGDMRISKSN